MLLEATGDGVIANPLRGRLRVYGEEFTHNMCIRHLKGDVGFDRKVQLREFVKSVSVAAVCVKGEAACCLYARVC